MPCCTRFVRFFSPIANVTGRIDFRWKGPGDVLPLALEVALDGRPDGIRAEVWTNINNIDNTSRFSPIPMTLSRVEGGTAIYRVDIPVLRVGNYRAAARLIVDGEDPRWMSQDGLKDLLVRPRDLAFEGLNMVELSIPNANAHDGRCGTMADLMEPGTPFTNGRYTLEWLQQQGKNALWLMPITRKTMAEVHRIGTAGSPYAVADFFAVRTELSRRAQDLQGPAAEQAAMDEFRELLDHAHALGMRVILDLPLNHLGHQHFFRDLFVERNADGVETREVRADDFRNLKCCPEHAQQLERNLADPRVPRYLECLAPWLYGSRRRDPAGARNLADIVPGGWFEWQDTLQLNHGRFRCGFREWGDFPANNEQRTVLAWLSRVLRYWAVDVGVDGFRIDHLSGMPASILDETINAVHADVEAHTPGRPLLILGEDFDTAHHTGHWVDFLQGGWFHELLKMQSPADLHAVLESPWFRHMLSLSSHDEDRAVTHFPDQPLVATTLSCLLQLVGGPVSQVMGDEVGEHTRLPFTYVLPAISQVSDEKRPSAELVARAGCLHRDQPALQTADRAWLRTTDGELDPHLMLLLRFNPWQDNAWVLVAANFHRIEPREAHFSLAPFPADRLVQSGRYQAHNLMSAQPQATLWTRLGADLVDNGLRLVLNPLEVQVLTLERTV